MKQNKIPYTTVYLRVQRDGKELNHIGPVGHCKTLDGTLIKVEYY